MFSCIDIVVWWKDMMNNWKEEGKVGTHLDAVRNDDRLSLSVCSRHDDKFILQVYCKASMHY